MTEDIKGRKTSLYTVHTSLNAKMALFGGFMMPIQYEGIIKEHQAARQNAALFDTDHMGEFRLMGKHAVSDLEKIVSCDVAPLKQGQCRYGLMCNENGGVIDDLLVYRLGENDLMIVVNAGTQGNDFDWIKSHLSPDTTMQNISAQTAKIDIQGPKSPEIVQKLMGGSIRDLKFYHFMHNTYHDRPIILSRTGYTGEIGFEVYLNTELAHKFWNECMSLGAVPAGLGARDTLRLEMGMPLYGHELDETRNAGESGFNRSISGTKQFTGSDAVRDQSKLTHRLTGIEIPGRRAARNGDLVLDAGGKQAGVITSGSFSPSLGYAVALAYIEAKLAIPGTPLKIVNANKQELTGAVADLPFYKNATGRRPVAEFIKH